MIRFVNCSFALQFAHSFFFACQVILFQVPQNQQKKNKKKQQQIEKMRPLFVDGAALIVGQRKPLSKRL